MHDIAASQNIVLFCLIDFFMFATSLSDCAVTLEEITCHYASLNSFKIELNAHFHVISKVLTLTPKELLNVPAQRAPCLVTRDLFPILAARNRTLSSLSPLLPPLFTKNGNFQDLHLYITSLLSYPSN